MRRKIVGVPGLRGFEGGDNGLIIMINDQNLIHVFPDFSNILDISDPLNLYGFQLLVVFFINVHKQLASFLQTSPGHWEPKSSLSEMTWILLKP